LRPSNFECSWGFARHIPTLAIERCSAHSRAYPVEHRNSVRGLSFAGPVAQHVGFAVSKRPYNCDATRGLCYQGKEQGISRIRGFRAHFRPEQVAKSLSRIAWLHPYADRLAFWSKIEAFSELLENAIASSNKGDIAYARRAMRSCALSANKLVDDLMTYSSTILGKLLLMDKRHFFLPPQAAIPRNYVRQVCFLSDQGALAGTARNTTI
jgi:hypothetical protein